MNRFVRPVRFHAGRSLVPMLLLLAVGLIVARGEQNAYLITPGPVNFVKGSSHVTRPVASDETLHVVSVSGDDVTVSDFLGFQAKLQRHALRIADAPAAAPAIDSAKTEPGSPTPAPTRAAADDNTTTPAPVVHNPTPAPEPVANAPAPVADAEPQQPLSSEDAEMMKKVNDALQFPLFADASLWGDDVDQVAAR